MDRSNKNLEVKIDRLLEDVTEVRITLAKHGVFHEANTESLIEHMSRTKASEARIESLEKYNYKVMGAMLTVSILGTLFYALHSMGIISKLFGG